VGCGDFLVGARLAPYAERYLAFDISRTVIEINRERYAQLTHVTFGVLNVVEDPLPACDLLLIRQVFQHLTNEQIESALRNIEKAQPKHALITEQIHKPELMHKVNADLKGHSVITRIAQKSGVDIGAAPFSRRRRVAAVLEPGPENKAEPDSLLCIYEMYPGAT
jgi:hypothetical protein